VGSTGRTDTRVALLRGINVGTAKRVAMADLRALVESLGYGNVRTLLNSGNVVFTVPSRLRGNPAARIETAIAKRLGVTTRVTMLSAKDIETAVQGNPLESVADNPSRLLLMVLTDRSTRTRLEPLRKQRWAPEAFALGERVAYLWLSNGVMDSPLWSAVTRVVGDGGTARNITTMTRILSLVNE